MRCKTMLLVIAVLISTTTLANPLTLVTLQQPPVQYEEGGVAKGITVDIAREVFRRMQQPIDVQVMPFPRTLLLMQTGKAEGIFSIVKTAEREQFLAYPNEILLTQEAVMVVRKNDTVRFNGDFSNLKDKVFAVLHNATYGPAYQQAVNEGHLNRFETVESYQQSARMLMSGRIDVMIGPRLSLLYALKQVGHSQDYRVLEPAIQSVPTFLAFPASYRNSSLIRAFDDSLQAVKRDGTYERIIRGYIE